MIQNKYIKFGLKTLLITSAAIATTSLLAEGPKNIAEMADNLKGNFSAIGNLIIATARVAGIGFTVAAIFKFKQHKDNPTQVTIGTPFALLAVGIMLMFMQSIYNPAAKSIYGKDADISQFDGVDDGTFGSSSGNN